MKLWSRRKFFVTSLVGSTAASAGGQLLGLPKNVVSSFGVAPAARQGTSGRPPVVISSANGLHALDKGMAVLKKNGDTLDAALAVVTVLEDDPNETSVGYGGLPNEDGEVELDASVMHGPTRRAGAVASIRSIKNPSRVAKVVMEQSNHVLLVGPGARRFAEAHGFERMNLLTERSRTAWLAWKAATAENWRPGLDSPDWKEKLARLLDTPEKMAWREWMHEVVTHPPMGTMNCLAVDEKGDLSGVTSTSGLAWKIAGRVGDS